MEAHEIEPNCGRNKMDRDKQTNSNKPIEFGACLVSIYFSLIAFAFSVWYASSQFSSGTQVNRVNQVEFIFIEFYVLVIIVLCCFVIYGIKTTKPSFLIPWIFLPGPGGVVVYVFSRLNPSLAGSVATPLWVELGIAVGVILPAPFLWWVVVSAYTHLKTKRGPSNVLMVTGDDCGSCMMVKCGEKTQPDGPCEECGKL